MGPRMCPRYDIKAIHVDFFFIFYFSLVLLSDFSTRSNRHRHPPSPRGNTHPATQLSTNPATGSARHPREEHQPNPQPPHQHIRLHVRNPAKVIISSSSIVFAKTRKQIRNKENSQNFPLASQMGRRENRKTSATIASQFLSRGWL